MPYERDRGWQSQLDDAEEAERMRESRGSGLFYQIQNNDKALFLDDSRLLAKIIHGTNGQRSEALQELRGVGPQRGSIFRCVRRCFWLNRLWKEGTIIETDDQGSVPHHFVELAPGPETEGGEIVLNVLLDAGRPGRRYRVPRKPEVERESPDISSPDIDTL